MRTEFSRVYVLVNVHSLDLWCQMGGGGEEETPAYCFPCQLGKWVIYHEILPGRSLRVTICWVLHITCDRSAKVCSEKNVAADLRNFTPCQWLSS